MASIQDQADSQQQWAAFQESQLQGQWGHELSSPSTNTSPSIKIEADSDYLFALSTACSTVDSVFQSGLSGGAQPTRRSIPGIIHYQPRSSLGSPITQSFNLNRRERRVRASIPDHLDISEASPAPPVQLREPGGGCDDRDLLGRIRHEGPVQEDRSQDFREDASYKADEGYTTDREAASAM